MVLAFESNSRFHRRSSDSGVATDRETAASGPPPEVAVACSPAMKGGCVVGVSD